MIHIDNEIYSKLKVNCIIKVKLRESDISNLRKEHNYNLSKITVPMTRHYYGDFEEPVVDENGYIKMKL